MLYSSGIVGAGGFFWCLKVSCENRSATYFNLRSPRFYTTRAILEDTLESRRVVYLAGSVSKVLGLVCYAKVGSSIIQRVAIDMVDMHSIGCVGNDTVHSLRSFFVFTDGNATKCVEVAATRPWPRIPLVLRKSSVVF